jgi:segregation and condensation protein B
MTDSPAEPTPRELTLEARVEALLFVSPSRVSISQLAQILETSPREIELALEQLESTYASRGIRLQRSNRSIQLTTAPELANDVERFLGLEETTSLSRAALEVLAIIAYQQPVTRPLIDSIRGVNSDSVLRTLLRHGLIEEVGRTEAPGRPILYSTTEEFLAHFGLGSLADLPPLNLEQEPVLKNDSEMVEREGDLEES